MQDEPVGVFCRRDYAGDVMQDRIRLCKGVLRYCMDARLEDDNRNRPNAEFLHHAEGVTRELEVTVCLGNGCPPEFPVNHDRMIGEKDNHVRRAVRQEHVVVALDVKPDLLQDFNHALGHFALHEFEALLHEAFLLGSQAVKIAGNNALVEHRALVGLRGLDFGEAFLHSGRAGAFFQLLQAGGGKRVVCPVRGRRFESKFNVCGRVRVNHF